LGNGVPGDTETPEQTIPATGLSRDWETCMTMNHTWGYKKEDNDWKSTGDLLHNLVDIASKGGNFLLNVGPTAQGIIPQPSVERLTAMGRWLRINGQSIYGTSASPFRKLSWGRATTRRGTIYLHVFNWPRDGKLVVPGLKNKVLRAHLLSTRKAVPLTRNGDDVILSLPAQAPDKVDTVVALKIVGVPDVLPFANVQNADGSLTLRAVEADLHGETLRYEEGHGKDNIGYWTNAKDWVSWDIEVKQPGNFDVVITYAADKGSGDSEYSVAVGKQSVAGKVEVTGSWATFISQRIGTIEVARAGRYSLTVKPTKQVGAAS
jgi:alpha-L-fucosidase